MDCWGGWWKKKKKKKKSLYRTRTSVSCLQLSPPHLGKGVCLCVRGSVGGWINRECGQKYRLTGEACSVVFLRMIACTICCAWFQVHNLILGWYENRLMFRKTEQQFSHTVHCCSTVSPLCLKRSSGEPSLLRLVVLHTPDTAQRNNRAASLNQFLRAKLATGL